MQKEVKKATHTSEDIKMIQKKQSDSKQNS